MKNPFVKSRQRYSELFGSQPEVIARAPGRVNIIGEHTDYNQGFVLPAAINRSIQVQARKREDRKVIVWAENFREEESFTLQNLKFTKNKKWANYVKAMFWVLEQDGHSLGGVDAFIAGDIPLESGLSSSAALEISLIVALDNLFKLSLSQKKMALLAQKAENDFVGVRCGLMDQFISVCAKKKSAIFLDCLTLDYEHIPLRLEDFGVELVVYDTRVSRELAFSEYNTRRIESSEALSSIKQQVKGIESYRDVDIKSLELLKPTMKDTLYKRARHVILENQRVLAAVDCLRCGDLVQLGELLFQSHKSLRDDYEVSCPELDLLYSVGCEFQGCLGARLTGAGFGGSGIALVESSRTEAFIERMKKESSLRRFKKPVFHRLDVADGAKIVL